MILLSDRGEHETTEMDGEKDWGKVLTLGSGIGANDGSNVLFASYGHAMNELSACSSV